MHRSRGNDVLMRLKEKSSIKSVEIQLSRRPRKEIDQFSVGSVPTSACLAGNNAATWVDLAKWANCPLIVARTQTDAFNYSWGSFVATYANKWGGAHIDQTIPQHLQIIDRYDAGGLSLSAYLLRSAAVQVWQISQVLLSDLHGFADKIGADESALMHARVTAPGGDASDPRDLRSLGELQWLDQSTDSVDLLAYVDDESSMTMTIPAGKISYELVFEPSSGTEQQRRSIPKNKRARDYQPSDLNKSDLSLGRKIRTSGRFLSFREVDPIIQTD
jgi:hypothetical protein